MELVKMNEEDIAEKVVNDFVHGNGNINQYVLLVAESIRTLENENRTEKKFHDENEIHDVAIRYSLRNFMEKNYNDTNHEIYELCVHDFRRWTFINMSIEKLLNAN
jgi:hypothetical protein